MRPSKSLRPSRLAILLVGLAAIAAVGGGVTRTPLFMLRTLTVTGNHRLSDAQVARLAGLSRHTNVVWLRTSSLVARIERDPWILQARVSRSLPGTLTVSIQERRPVAVLETGRSLLLVSGDGVILGQASRSARLPTIWLPGSTATIGARIPSSTAVLVVARSLPPSLRGKVAQIKQSGPGSGSLSVTLREGAEVFYGDATEPETKGRALGSLLSWARAHGVRPKTIDLRAPSAPALVPEAG